MKKQLSIKPICKHCKRIYRFNRLYLICIHKKHKQHQ